MARPSDILRGVGRPIAYYPRLRKITGSTVATIFLCQFIYWKGKEKSGDGWIYKVQEEIKEETGLSRYEQETARDHLKERGLLSEKKEGLPCQTFYKINYDVLDNLWDEKMNPDEPRHVQNGGLPQTSMGDSNNQECGNATNQNVENNQTSMGDSNKQVSGNATNQKSANNPEITVATKGEILPENTTENTTNSNNNNKKPGNKNSELLVDNFQKAFGKKPNDFQKQKLSEFIDKGGDFELLLKTIEYCAIGGHNQTFFFRRLDILMDKGIYKKDDLKKIFRKDNLKTAAGDSNKTEKNKVEDNYKWKDFFIDFDKYKE